MSPSLSQVWFPLITATVLITTLVVIPRQVYKKYFLYGLMTGGIGTVALILLLEKALHVVRYKNLGVFMLFGVSAWAPLEWTFFHMLFLYFLPVRVGFLIPYLGSFGLLAVVMGLLARNLGLFAFTPWFFFYVAPFIFIGWFGAAAWFFRTREGAPDPFDRAVTTVGRREADAGEGDEVEPDREQMAKRLVKVEAEAQTRRRRPWLTIRKRDRK